MKNILIALLVLMAVLTGGRAFADENAAAGQPAPDGGQTVTDGGAQGNTDYSMPSEGNAWLGYNFFDLQGSRKAAEYEYPYGSVVGGFNVVYVPLPTRWEANLEWVNPNSWDADLSFAYKDMVKVDYTGWALWRNYNHYGLIGGPIPGGLHPLGAPRDTDIGDNYFTDDRDNRLSLVLKWPDRPYHVFVNMRHFEKEGTIQARFFDVSQTLHAKESLSRDIDWVTTKLNVGINGHFGPVEAEYSHTAKTFDPHGEVEIPILESGLYPSHVPQYDDNLDTVKLHTDYTGRIVADSTFINGERRNEHSEADLKYRRAYGDVTLIPANGLTVAIRYRGNWTDETVEAVPAGTGSLTPTVTPTNPISYRSNRAEVSVRYNPITVLAFNAEYSYENLQRYNVDAWNAIVSPGTSAPIIPFQSIPSQQNIHKVTAGVTSDPARWINFRGGVEYTYTGEPAYPVNPKNSYKARADVNIIPMSALSANLHYRLTVNDNNTSDMHSDYNNPGVGLIWTPGGPFTMSVNYDYFRYNMKREIILQPPPLTVVSLSEELAPYDDQSHVYSVSGDYVFAVIPLTLDAEFHQSFSKGVFRIVETGSAGSTAGIGELADLADRETGGSITAKYALHKGWGLSATYGINNFVDFKNKPQDGPQNGTAQTVMMLATKKW